MPNRLVRLAVMLAILAAAAACELTTVTGDTGVPIASEPVMSTNNSGILDRRRLVVRSAAEWNALWAEAMAMVQPAPPVPPVDFASEMLLVASMGVQASGGHSIGIDSIQAAGGIIHAVVRETSPSQSCVVTGAQTAPVTAVRVSRSTAPVEFRSRTVVHVCR